MERGIDDRCRQDGMFLNFGLEMLPLLLISHAIVAFWGCTSCGYVPGKSTMIHGLLCLAQRLIKTPREWHLVPRLEVINNYE